MCQDYHNRRERSSWTLNTAKTTEDLEPTNRVRGSLNANLLKEDVKGMEFLAKLP